jgi:hypothetical protein
MTKRTSISAWKPIRGRFSLRSQSFHKQNVQGGDNPVSGIVHAGFFTSSLSNLDCIVI